MTRLVSDLRSGRVNHRSDKRMKINVMDWPGRGYISMDNRRLHCLKEYQTRCVPPSITVRAELWRLPRVFVDLVEQNGVMLDFLRKFDGLRAIQEHPRVRRRFM